MESATVAAERGAVDRAIVALLFQGGCGAAKPRRSLGATCRTSPTVPASWYGCAGRKPDQQGTAVDVRYLKNGCASALRQLRDRITVQRSGVRPEPTAPVLDGLASELTARGAPPPPRQMLAGGWKTARMVAHHSAAATAEQAAIAKYL